MPPYPPFPLFLAEAIRSRPESRDYYGLQSIVERQERRRLNSVGVVKDGPADTPGAIAYRYADLHRYERSFRIPSTGGSPQQGRLVRELFVRTTDPLQEPGRSREPGERLVVDRCEVIHENSAQRSSSLQHLLN